ncbi:hypothetical protein Droror1_Dr00027483 [Drosera rotundifolia]
MDVHELFSSDTMVMSDAVADGGNMHVITSEHVDGGKGCGNMNAQVSSEGEAKSIGCDVDSGINEEEPQAGDLGCEQEHLSGSVFVRDFVPSGLACMMKSPHEAEIVKNFLIKTLLLQGRENRIDNFTLGDGVMPASFRVSYDSHRNKDTITTDFGGSAIGRVAPVDSGFWWIICQMHRRLLTVGTARVLLWLLTAACIKTGRPLMAKREIALVEQRLLKDGWPEYYDGKTGRYVGKQARKYQTWSISGYLVAKLLVENPSNIAMISFEEDKQITKPRLTRSSS